MTLDPEALAKATEAVSTEIIYDEKRILTGYATRYDKYAEAAITAYLGARAAKLLTPNAITWLTEFSRLNAHRSRAASLTLRLIAEFNQRDPAGTPGAGGAGGEAGRVKPCASGLSDAPSDAPLGAPQDGAFPASHQKED
jgi:hypothetical protein